MSKAFDMVNHEKLLLVLSNLGFRGLFNNLIKSCLSDRVFRIKTNDDYSEYLPVQRGVPQGGIISPIIFCLYVNDLSSVHEKVVQYADDSTLIIPYTDIKELQTKLNANKTEIVLFGDKKLTQLYFKNYLINTSHTTKFLGIFLTQNRKFDYHVLNYVIPSIRRLFSVFTTPPKSLISIQKFLFLIYLCFLIFCIVFQC